MRFLTLISLIALGTSAAAADPEVINKTCPISGKAVDSSVKTTPFTYQTNHVGAVNPGRSYAVGFCCPKCEPTYNKDPEKYREGLMKQTPHGKKN